MFLISNCKYFVIMSFKDIILRTSYSGKKVKALGVII